MSLPAAYTHFDQGKAEAIAWLQQEIAHLRTGRAKPALVENVTVEHYGTRMPLKGVASIANSDARTLMVSPWDPQAIPAIEKALTVAALGTQPIVDGAIVRLVFPQLTTELRERTVKLLHQKAEEARIRCRIARDEAMKILQTDKQNGALSEDDFYIGKEDLQKSIEETNEVIAGIVTAKEEEIRTV